MTVSRRRLACAAGLCSTLLLGEKALAAAPITISSATALREASREPAPDAADVCDVVVVGAGAAGLAAAVSAKGAGAKRVVVLEKGALAGGHMIVSSGMLNALDPEGQKRAHRKDSVEQFFRDTYEGGGGKGNPDLIATMVRSSAEVFAWMKSLGVEFDPMVYEAYTGVFPRAHKTIQARSGMEYGRALMRQPRRWPCLQIS